MEKYTKRLLSLALVVVMVFSMMPDFSFAASAQTETQSQTDISSLPADAQTAIQNAASYSQYAKENLKFTGSTTVTARCPFCNEVDVSWEPITAAKAFAAAGGHYYLAEDITASDNALKTTWRSNDADTAASTKVCLNLNGKNVTTTAGAALYISHGGTYNVFDPYAGTDKASVLTGNGANYYSAGSLFVGNATSAPVVNLYGGIFRKSQVATGNDVGEPVVYLNDTGNIVNMFEGTVIDGSNCNFFNSAGYPAAVTMMGSAGKTCRFNMYGGEITGSDLVCESNEAYTGGRAVSIYAQNADAAGQFTMYAGTITGGKVGANYVGASVFIKKGAVFTMEGGKIGGGIRNTTTEDIYVEDGGTLTNNTYVDAIDAVRFANSSYSYSAKCRHCNTAKTWKAMAGALGDKCANGDHLLMTANVGDTAQWALLVVSSAATMNVCWALNGKTVHTGRSSKAYNAGATLSIMGKGEVIGVDGDKAETEAFGTIAVQWGGKLNLYGGTYSTNNGKPVLYVQGGACNVTVHEGVVFKDNAGTATNLVNVTHDTPITMDGVTVSGNMNMGVASTKLVLSGKTTINQLSLVTGCTLDVSGLTAGADIKVAAPDGVFTKALGTPAAAETAAGYFSIYNGDGTKAVYTNKTTNELEIGTKRGGYNDPLVFGGDGKAWCPDCEDYFEWIPITAGNTLLNGGSHYYLPSSLNITGKGVITSSTQPEVCLHLNDKELISSDAQAISAENGNTLNIMGPGTVSGTCWYGAVYVGNANTVINIHSGTFTRDAANTNRPVIRFNATGRVNMFGGEIGTPNNTLQSGSNAAINLDKGTFVLNGGTVNGFTGSTAGGAIVASGATLIVNGGTFTGGKVGTAACDISVASGGSVVLSGKPQIGNLKLAAGVVMDATGMTGGSVALTAENGVISTEFGTKEEAETAAGYFSIYNGDGFTVIAANSDKKLEIADLPSDGKQGGYNDTLDFGTDGKAWCPACERYVKWTELKGNATTLVESGTYAHYYLSGDYTSSTTGIRLTNADACLHLNGHTLTSTGDIALQVNATGRTLNVMGQGKITGAVNDAWYGSALYTKGQQVNFYSDVTLTKASTATGPILHADTCEVNLIGNVTIGEEGLTYDASSKAAVTTRGAAVINMQKGTIIGGKNSTGNAYASAFATYNAGGTLNMTGGEIRSDVNGAANALFYPGHNVTINIGANATLTATTVFFSYAATNSNAALTIEGTVNGIIKLQSNTQSSIILKGQPTVTNLILSAGQLVNATGMTGGNVAVTAADGVISTEFGTKEEAKAVADYFSIYGGSATKTIFANDAKKLELGVEFVYGEMGDYEDALDFSSDNKTAYCPVCENYFEWTAITQAEIEGATGSTSWAKALVDGHYYLKEDLSSSTKHVLGLSWNKQACLHLNDHDITATGAGKSAIYAYYPKGINIMGTGTVSGVGTITSGAALHVTDSNKTVDTGVPVINIYSGTFTKAVNDTVSSIIYIHEDGGEVNMYGGQIGEMDVTLTSTNGAVYLNGTNATAKFVLHDGTIYGVGSTNGSAVLCGGTDSLFQMNGGTITSTITDKFLIVTSGGQVVIGPEAVLTGTATGAINQWSNGGSITISGKVNGKVQITRADVAFVLSGAPELDHLYMSADVMVDVNGMTGGEVAMYVKDNSLRVFTTEITGDKAAAIAQCFTYVTSSDEKLIIVAEGDYLAIEKASLVTIVNGVETPMSPADALEAAHDNPDAVIKLLCEGITLPLDDHNVVVDMNGFSGTISGTGKVYGVDKSTDNFGMVTAGILTVVGNGVEVMQDVTSGGNRYLYIMHGEGNYSFHRVIIKLTQIVLNTTNSAIYYKAQFQSDETLANRVDNFGINYSLEKMPSTTAPLGTQIPVPMDGKFTGSNNATTSYIRDIVTEGNDQNSAEAERKIYANPYIYLNVDGNDNIVGFDQYKVDDTNAKSLQDLLEYYETNTDNSYSKLTEERKQVLAEFCVKMGLTEFTNLCAPAVPAPTNDEEEEE